MNILDYFYSQKPLNDRFFPRKLLLPEAGSFILSGARGTGKSTLIADYIKHRPAETLLYIDCQDPVFALEDIDIALLESFLKEESINMLVLDHYYENFLERLPDISQLVLVCRIPPENTKQKIFELFPLDYEEFLGFERKSTPVGSYNHFLKTGTIPAISTVSPGSVSQQMRHFFYENFDEQEGRLLLILSRFHGRRASAHQIYTQAKEYFRISKDWTYRTLKKFREEKVLLFVDSAEKSSRQKMFLYDFALTRYLNKPQPFPVTFDSMIALALFKHNIHFLSAEPSGYYLPAKKELVYPLPFEDEMRFRQRSKIFCGQFDMNISKVSLVTVSNRFAFSSGTVLFEALPFYEWSILNE